MQGVAKTASEALWCKQSAQTLTQYQQPEDNQPSKSSQKNQNPLINRVYFHRSMVMHTLIKNIVELYPSSNPTKELQLLSLGGGLDDSYSKYCTKQYIVDLPAVIDERKKIISESPSSVLIAGDLTDIEAVIQSLEANQFAPSNPTIILIECVLSYILPEAVSQILTTLSQYISESYLIIYDPILPPLDPSTEKSNPRTFSESMIKMFEKRKAPLLSSRANTKEMIRLLIDCQWDHCQAFTMSQALQILLTSAERNVLPSLEPFDEFASLQTLHNLYSIAIASSSSKLFQTWWNHMIVSYQRMATLEERQLSLRIRSDLAYSLLSIKKTLIETSNTLIASQTSNTQVSLVTANDLESILHVYQSAFQPYLHTSKSVEKYIKMSCKEMKKWFSKITNTSSNNSNLKMWKIISSTSSEILGCIAIQHSINQSSSSTSSLETIPSSLSYKYEIKYFSVHPQYHHHGFGKLLLQTALDDCMHQVKSLLSQHLNPTYTTTIELTVLEELIAARKLYESVGFKTLKVMNITSDCTLHHMIKEI